MPEKQYIDRPPRFQPELPMGEHEIPGPPAKEGRQQPLWQLLLPAITIVGYLLISIFGRGRSIWLMIPMGISVVVSIIAGVYMARQDRQKQEEAEAAYSEHLIEMRRKMMREHDMQRRFYLHNYPDPLKTMQIAFQSAKIVDGNKSTEPASTARLWERRTSDSDFCAIRLGMGTLPSTVRYELGDGGSIDDPQLRDAIRLAEDSRYVDDVPIMVPLRSYFAPGSASDTKVEPKHAIGITGNDPRGVYAFARSVIANFATFQSPADSRIYVLSLDKGRSMWEWILPLPHCQSDKPSSTVCFEDERDRQDNELSKVERFLKSMRQLLDERMLRLKDPDYQLDVSLPHLLLVIDLLASPVNGSRLNDLEADPAISLIMKEGPALGASVLFLVPSTNKVPGDCKSIIEIDFKEAHAEIDVTKAPRVSFKYAETGVNSSRYSGRSDTLPNNDLLKQFAQTLAPLEVRKSYGADLPQAVQILDMFGVRTMEQLKSLLKKNWRESQESDQADWLKAPLGMQLGGEYRTLKFSADADGVHGLIAGSTGSGKSELLMTMILGLAVNYDPSIVNFVLVDFKGGGAFKPLEGLPHVVDVVTNLGESAVERMFAAIKAELNRRSAINTNTNSKHLVHYRRRGLHTPDDLGRYGQPVEIQDQQFQTEPYPHLFVFIDEFAEMIADNPEYKAQLNSITRLGRALGVTLILAAQRPSGVTDQMRANIKFRIALRVETREESSEVLRRSDAAYLPTGVPGRGYLQIGNENIEMIQIAWSGADYTGEQVRELADVIWLDRAERIISGDGSDQNPRVFEEMVLLMSATAEEFSIPQNKPWPDFLPEKFSLQTPFDASYFEDEMGLVDLSDDLAQQTAVLNPWVSTWFVNSSADWPATEWRSTAMRAVVGLVDNPYQAEQMPLLVDFRRGHAIVFGASGWGKTVFLRTVLTTLAANHSPNDLHVYILDFGGRQMNVFRDLPHVGAIITADEEERVRRLLRKVDNNLENRKRTVTEQGGDSLYSYNLMHPENALPAILVIIDNFAEFKESFEGLLPQLTSLLREARAWGVHFIVSAESPGAVSGKVYSLLTERYALKLSDPSEYSGIVGRSSSALDDIPGRGFVRVDRRALEFQTALPVDSSTDLEDESETSRLFDLVANLKNRAKSISADLLAPKVTTLPTMIALHDIVDESWPDPERSQPRITPFIGMDDLNLARWSLDLMAYGPHCMVIGTPNSGTTTFLRSLTLSLSRHFTPQEVTLVMVDFQQRFFNYGGRSSLEDLPHVAQAFTNSDHIDAFVESLREACQTKLQAGHSIWVIIDNYESFSDDVSDNKAIMPQLSVLAREFGTMGLHFVIGGSPDVTRMPDLLRKQVQVPRFGIALDVESVSRLNGSVPRTLMQEELPVGRGFVIKSGRTLMVQFASAYTDSPEIENQLDEWISEIVSRYPNQKAVWPTVSQNEEEAIQTADADSLTSRGDHSGATTQPLPPVSQGEGDGEEDSRRYALSSGVPNDVDITSLRQELEAMFGSSVDFLSKTDVYNTAVSLGIVKALEETEA